MHILHFGCGVFAVPRVDRAIAAFGAADQKRQLASRDNWETSRLITWIDVSEIGDAIARHVVMVECLAELLRRIDFICDRSVRGLLDVVGPVLDGLLQRMRRRHPVREL